MVRGVCTRSVRTSRRLQRRVPPWECRASLLGGLLSCLTPVCSKVWKDLSPLSDLNIALEPTQHQGSSPKHERRLQAYTSTQGVLLHSRSVNICSLVKSSRRCCSKHFPNVKPHGAAAMITHSVHITS